VTLVIFDNLCFIW